MHFIGDGKGKLCHLKFRTLKYQQVGRQLLVVWNSNVYMKKLSLLFYLYLNYVTFKNTVWKEGHISYPFTSFMHMSIQNSPQGQKSNGYYGFRRNITHAELCGVTQYSLFISSVTIHSLLISSELKTEHSFNPALLLSRTVSLAYSLLVVVSTHHAFNSVYFFISI